jgi:hypothetical protein
MKQKDMRERIVPNTTGAYGLRFFAADGEVGEIVEPIAAWRVEYDAAEEGASGIATPCGLEGDVNQPYCIVQRCGDVDVYVFAELCSFTDRDNAIAYGRQMAVDDERRKVERWARQAAEREKHGAKADGSKPAETIWDHRPKGPSKPGDVERPH